MPQLKNVRIDLIRTNPIALRDVNRQGEQFQELLNSIRSQGIVSPISLREKPGEDGKQFELVDGLQRFTSAQEVGTGIRDRAADGESFEGVYEDVEGNKIGLVPAQILDRTDAEALLTQIIGNVQRVDTKPVEYAAGLRRLLGYHATWTQAELAAKLNKGPGWIDKQLGLLKLHDQIKPLVDEGKIVLANAYVLTKLPPDEQIQWLDRAQTEAADVFGPAVQERVKKIREANRKGEDAAPAEFTPTPHLRKKTELEPEMNEPQVLPALIQELNVTGSLKANKDGLLAAAQLGAQLALQWALNFDPKSKEAQKKAHEERSKHLEEQRIRRDAEKKQKRAKEAAERTAKAEADAKLATEKAAQLPPVPEPVGAAS